MKRLLTLGALSTLALTGCMDDDTVTGTTPAGLAEVSARGAANGPANANPAATHVYEVTIENLTEGQPLSPGVVVAHTKQQSLFRAGQPASEGVRLIAENGDPSVAEADLGGAAGVNDVVATPRPAGCIGCGGPFASSLTVEIEAAANANRLSLAVMLICTNDGFAGLDTVKLPGGFQPATFYANAYDAGTEANDQLFTSLVGPCGGIGPVAVPDDGLNDRTATDGLVAPHPGITDSGDLEPDDHGWEDPVAKVTVRRLQ